MIVTHNLSPRTITADDTAEFQRTVAEHLIGFAWNLAAATRPARPTPVTRHLDRRPETVLVDLATTIKDGIRTGALGQFDPISTEPQLVALNSAQGTIERIATTPTSRQYAYFTRRLIELFALVAPFALIGLVPDAVWPAAPLSLLLAGNFIVLAVPVPPTMNRSPTP